MLYHQPHNSTGNYSYNAFFYDNIHYTPHFHKNFELIYVLSGEVFCTAGTKSATVHAGEFALCLSNEVHALQSLGDSRCWIGVFSGDFVNAFETQMQGKESNHFVFRCDQTTTALLTQHLIHTEKPPLYLMKACLYAACAEFSKIANFKPQAENSDLLMRAMVDYIAQHYRQKISLSTMAERLGYNYHYLSRCFHRIFRMSFPEFLNTYRLEAALSLLRKTDREIVDIALESGFQSLRNFNELFRSHVGTTPTKYRQNSNF